MEPLTSEDEGLRPQYIPIEEEVFLQALSDAPWNAATDLCTRALPLYTLRYHCIRRIALQVFATQCHPTGDLRRAKANLEFTVKRVPIPPKERVPLFQAITLVISEVAKWASSLAATFTHSVRDDNEMLPVNQHQPNRRLPFNTASRREFDLTMAKNRRLMIQQRQHVQLMQSKSPKNRPHPAEHLKLYFHCIVWMPNRYIIDAWATARNVVNSCGDWPTMRWQLSCAYAQIHVLENEFYGDHVRLNCIEKKFGDHPLHNFWLEFIRLGPNKCYRLFDRMNDEHIMPKQCVSLCLRWAIDNGHVQLTAFFMEHLSLAQFEYLGLLEWRRMCFSCRHTHMFEWLCGRMCIINLYGMARNTWNAFYTALHETLNERLHKNEVWTHHLERLEYLLTHCCDRLRWALLRAQDHRALHSLLMYKDQQLLELFTANLSSKQLRKVIQFYERETPSDELSAFLHLLRGQLLNAEFDEKTTVK